MKSIFRNIREKQEICGEIGEAYRRTANRIDNFMSKIEDKVHDPPLLSRGIDELYFTQKLKKIDYEATAKHYETMKTFPFLLLFRKRSILEQELNEVQTEGVKLSYQRF